VAIAIHGHAGTFRSLQERNASNAATPRNCLAQKKLSGRGWKFRAAPGRDHATAGQNARGIGEIGLDSSIAPESALILCATGSTRNLETNQ
jgi:hypothetical protein